VLALQGFARPAALRAALGVSPATFARLVSASADEVYAFGRTRSLRYARRRTVGGLGRTAPVFRVDASGAPEPAGTLHFLWGSRIAWERRDGGVLAFEGLPPELVDMAPQGYLGHGFAGRHPELRLPVRLDDWTDDHRLVALARRGEDCVGDLVVGSESLDRFLRLDAPDVPPERYPELARAAAAQLAGSSAGGERPKFGAFTEGRHVLVKFQRLDDDAAARRWRDLLWCEGKALEVVGRAGRSAPRARVLDVEGWRFLQVERFDRVGRRGRRAAVSLAALANEHLGGPSTWTDAAPALRRPPLLLPAADEVDVRWLDAFGQLIGNTDRHLGNLTFFSADGGIRLAPIYDMLPMALAPRAGLVLPRAPAPEPAAAATLEVWPDAARWAIRYWSEVEGEAALEAEVRDHAARARAGIARLLEVVAPAR
jgi:hypothetical protein